MKSQTIEILSLLSTQAQRLSLGLTLVAAATAAHAVPISSQGTWTSSLQARDINSDGKVDAYYDTALNITWLADANFAKTSGFLTAPIQTGAQTGEMYWPTATTWAHGLDIYGITDWRLPTSSYASAPTFACSFVCSYAPEFAEDELSHLNLVTLGNAVGGDFNTAGFLNMAQSGGYNYESLYTTQYGSNRTGIFSFGSGGHTEISSEQVPAFAWAVHDGDISVAAPVPEPETYALMGLGLALMGAQMRKKKALNLTA